MIAADAAMDMLDAEVMPVLPTTEVAEQPSQPLRRRTRKRIAPTMLMQPEELDELAQDEPRSKKYKPAREKKALNSAMKLVKAAKKTMAKPKPKMKSATGSIEKHLDSEDTQKSTEKEEEKEGAWNSDSSSD